MADNKDKAGPSKPNNGTATGEEDLKPIGSLSEECTPLKIKYDECFNTWFSEKFLKGDRDLTVCDELFKAYNICLKAAMIRMNIDIKELNRDLLDTKTEEMKGAAKEKDKKK